MATSVEATVTAVPVTAGRRNRQQVILVLLAVLVLVAGMTELAVGPVGLSLPEVLNGLFGQGSASENAIVRQIRAPRLFLALAVASGLALSGCALQGILRNPLADPGLIGVTGGATVGAVATIVLGEALIQGLSPAMRPWCLPVAAFAGSMLVTGFVFTVSRRSSGISVATLILTGVAINAIAAAFVGAMVFASDDRQLRDLTFWSMGSLGGANWTSVAITLVIVGISAIFMLRQGSALDLFQLGERAAYHAGLDVERTKRRAALLTAISVGAATAAAGPIGFIGLVAPHMARLLVGPGHRMVLPASALLGTALLLGADIIVRNAVPPAEPPIGIATSLIGGPFFLWLLIRRLQGGGNA